MATTPINFGAIGAPTTGMGNSTSNYIPMPPVGGSANNPTGTSGGGTSATGVPMIANPQAVPGSGAASTLTPSTPPAANGTPSTLDPLSNLLGAGMGSYTSGLLQDGGINLPLANSVNTAEINAMQPGVNQGSANLNALLGAEGISGNSSVSALANSNYQSQVTGEENSLISQNYMQEYNIGQQMIESILSGVIPGEIQQQADQFNWEDIASLALGGAEIGTQLYGINKL